MTQTKDKTTGSDVQVSARTRLDETENPRDTTDTLREQAERQEKQQADELKAGTKGGVTKDGPTIAHNRVAVSHQSVGVQGGLVDQMTRRSIDDVMEGHFCTVDRTHKDVDTDLLPGGEDGYGVYLSPATTDEHGYPITANVRLRDATNATITVPYEALRPAEARGR